MTKVKLTKAFTVRQARKILAIAQKECHHFKVSFLRGSQPHNLEDAKEKGSWGYFAKCTDCAASSNGNTTGPICIKCSTLDKLATMRMVATRPNPSSRWGEIWTYTCDGCHKNEEFTFHSTYS